MQWADHKCMDSDSYISPCLFTRFGETEPSASTLDHADYCFILDRVTRIRISSAVLVCGLKWWGLDTLPIGD